jgi:hypothetical protein
MLFIEIYISSGTYPIPIAVIHNKQMPLLKLTDIKHAEKYTSMTHLIEKCPFPVSIDLLFFRVGLIYVMYAVKNFYSYPAAGVLFSFIIPLLIFPYIKVTL